MTPALIVQLLEIILPPIMQLIVNHYERKEELTDAQQNRLDAHKAALSTLQTAKGDK